MVGSTHFTNYVLAVQTGTTVPHISATQIGEYQFALLPLTEQQAIAHVLGTLDDKIEVNRRMNETLEEMARAIFKSWFVDFDPVKAKMDGRRPYGMDDETAALFPDSFEESKIGAIPTGWSSPQLGDVVDLRYGKALKAADRQPGTIPVYGSNGRVGWHNDRLAAGPSVILGRKGNPGAVEWSDSDFYAIDTTFYVVSKDVSVPMHYWYRVLEHLDLQRLASDSAVPGLNRNMAYMDRVLLPGPDILRVFLRTVHPPQARKTANDAESVTLAAIRDALLPKLISGELDVSGLTNLPAEAT